MRPIILSFSEDQVFFLRSFLGFTTQRARTRAFVESRNARACKYLPTLAQYVATELYQRWYLELAAK